jgi:hypothetical protein
MTTRETLAALVDAVAAYLKKPGGYKNLWCALLNAREGLASPTYSDLELRGALKMLDSAIGYINRRGHCGYTVTEITLRILMRAATSVSKTMSDQEITQTTNHFYSTTDL